VQQTRLDILINEISIVLQISPDEVKKTFTNSELEELLNITICDSQNDSGSIFTSSDIPCEDLSIPELFNEITLDLDSSVPKPPDSSKCIESTDKLNSQIENELAKYNDLRLLLEKLLEYRDNYEVISYYFSEKSNEAAIILKDFEPVLLTIETLKNSISSIQKQIAIKTIELSSVSQLDLVAVNNKKTEIRNLYSQLDSSQVKLTQQGKLLSKKTQSYPIFNDKYFKEYLGYLSDPESSDSSESSILRNIANNFLNVSTLTSLDTQLKSYSDCLFAKLTIPSPKNLQQLLSTQYFKFRLNFPNLNQIPLEKEKYDKVKDLRNIIKTNFKIRENSLLKKNSFFKDTSIFNLTNRVASKGNLPGGKLYTQFYNLFEDPVNNFFSPGERGLTNSISQIDRRVKGTELEKKVEGEKSFFVKDIEILQNFYSDFETRFNLKKEEKRKQVINPLKNKILLAFKSVARREVQLILALSGVNKFLPKNSGSLRSVVKQINKQNSDFLLGLKELNEEIARIEIEMEKLKPTPSKIKNRLKKLNPTCFGAIDSPETECPDVKSKLGIDPLFIETIKGCDPTLPNQTQICYWKEFSKIINTVGSLPIPHAKQPSPQLRYWPVGLTIPYPGGLVKLPLPVLWNPLLTIGSSAGTLVFFLTINGLFISPTVFFAASTGFKQHILTLRGSSPKIGFSASEDSIKSNIRPPLILLALKEKADRLANQAKFGKYYAFPEKEREKILQYSAQLESSSSAPVGEIKKLKLAKEKKDFTKATTILGDFEKTQATIDKLDSPKDIIDDLFLSILKRLDDLGKPSLNSSNSLKEKIIARRTKLYQDLQKKLELGDLDECAKIRTLLQSDGISISEKISSIESDLFAYFNKIKFPKLTIPKNSSLIDPKPTALVELINIVRDHSNIYSTQFYSKENAKVKNILSREIAKQKKTILEKIKSDSLNSDLDTKDLPKIKKALKDINSLLISFLVAERKIGDPSKIQQELTILKSKLTKEKNTNERRKIEKKITDSNLKLSQILEQDSVRTALFLTPLALSSFSSALIVDFNPFSPCCRKKEFSLPLNISPTVPVFKSVQSLLDAAVDRLTESQIQELFANKLQVSPNDIATAHLNIIRQAIPSNLEIPLPDLSLLTFFKTFAAIFIPLFDIKTPLPYLAPSLPVPITIDSSIAKKLLFDEFKKFIKSAIPQEDSQGSDSSLSKSVGAGQGSEKIPFSQDITLVSCNTAEDSSILSDGSYGAPKIKKNQESNKFGSGSHTLNSDISPAFAFISNNFINLNPGDLLSLIKSFFKLFLEKIEKLLTPFYKAVNLAAKAKSTNLGIIEAAQYKIPPHGPAAESLFIAIETAKARFNTSVSFKMFDLAEINKKITLIEPNLKKISSGPLPSLVAAAAGASDALFPNLRTPKVDTSTGIISLQDKKISTQALRALHPLVNQDDLPPWERLSPKNLLFLLFIDEFVSSGADKLGFFRSFI